MKIITMIMIMSVMCCSCVTPVPNWDETKYASCWHGANASQRMMNMLSPNMPDNVFDSYLNWMKNDRDCDTAHLILINKGDGQYSGYSPYGPAFGSTLDENSVNIMLDRIDSLRKEKFAVVIWIITDDSGPWAKVADGPMIINGYSVNIASTDDIYLYTNGTQIATVSTVHPFATKLKDRFPQVIQECKDAGLFKQASYVVLGLELDEYWNAPQVSGFANILRNITDLKVGIHQTSDKTDYAQFGDIFLWQTNPGKSPSQIKSLISGVVAKTGKPVVAFEMERQENRALCEAAFSASSNVIGCGNW